MSICKNCGNTVEDGNNFCPNCGQPIDSTQNESQNSGAGIAVARVILYAVLGIVLLFIEFMILPRQILAIMACIGVGIIAGVIIAEFMPKGLKGLAGFISFVIVGFLYLSVAIRCTESESGLAVVLGVFVPVVVFNMIVEGAVAFSITSQNEDK